jgi:hypothetical protein
MQSYLANIPPGRIPGCDGMTTDGMLSGYADFAARGWVPGYEELRQKHPEHALELAKFFSVITPPRHG